MTSPFRYCDVRGVYPSEVNEALFSRLAAGIAARCAPGESVLVARDFRASSPSLHRALVDGLSVAGVAVLDAGAAPTPVLYYGKRSFQVRYAASVTASHNPPSSNGLKILPPDHCRIAEEVRALAIEPSAAAARDGGSVRAVDLHQPYGAWLEERWRAAFRPPGCKAVVLDPGCGSWSGRALPIFERIGIPAAAIHDTPSGMFEERSPDCAAPGALVKLGEEVRRRGAAAGLAWDGDGDRLALCDDLGRPISADQLALLMVPQLLAEHPGEPILIDLKMSRRVHETIERCGGRPVVERSAHCLLERAMLEHQCLFGCEYSGHYFFRELGADDGMFAALQSCATLLPAQRPLSEAVDSLPPLFITPDIRIPGGDGEFQEILERLTAEFRSARIDRWDGLRINDTESWLVVRRSVSENKITCRAEGDSRTALDSILRRLTRVLPEYRNYLDGS